MESTMLLNREKALSQWLTACGLQDHQLKILPLDASFRRYFRVTLEQQSFIAMDTPLTVERDSCQPFVAIARALKQMGLNTPEIFHENIADGFLLMTDFGDMTFLKALNAENVNTLYEAALNALAKLQHCKQVPGREIPFFSAEFMWQEWRLHKEWFLEKLLQLKLSAEENAKLDQAMEFIITSAVSQPQVFMHRDYHAGNLMLLDGNQVGILDFQDAFIGPLTYDLVSLLRDCYVEWPLNSVQSWVLQYQQKLQQQNQFTDVSAEQFMRWFDLMGLQRHLKAILTFARKKVRDQDARYLKYIPRALNYAIYESAQFAELRDLHEFLKCMVQPAVISAEAGISSFHGDSRLHGDDE